MDACLKTSALWQHVQAMKLSQNMRAHVQLTVGDLGCFVKHLLKLVRARCQWTKTLAPTKCASRTSLYSMNIPYPLLCVHVFHNLASHRADPV